MLIMMTYYKLQVCLRLNAVWERSNIYLYEFECDHLNETTDWIFCHKCYTYIFSPHYVSFCVFAMTMAAQNFFHKIHNWVASLQYVSSCVFEAFYFACSCKNMEAYIKKYTGQFGLGVWKYSNRLQGQHKFWRGHLRALFEWKRGNGGKRINPFS